MQFSPLGSIVEVFNPTLDNSTKTQKPINIIVQPIRGHPPEAIIVDPIERARTRSTFQENLTFISQLELKFIYEALDN